MSDLKRDSISGAIINNDASALNYRKVDKLQDDILEIKRSIISIYERIEKLENK